MINKKIIIAGALVLLALASCAPKENVRPEGETEAPSDWRNTIEYESFFYVNPETKLLYSLDVGSIALWDNNGDGSILQHIEYESAATDAIESFSFKDVNMDGHNDIMNLYSEKETGKKYNLWLWDAAGGKYVECKRFRGINDPVISDDGKTVSGEEDKGAFGNIVTVYRITDKLVLEDESVTITNASDIATAISLNILGEAEVTKADGIATIDEVACPVFYAERDGSRIAYIAHSPEGHWYLDEGCTGAYRTVDYEDTAYVKGSYTGEMGVMADLCAELAGCRQRELTVGEMTTGYLCNLSYNENGTPILPDPDAEPDGIIADGYYFMRDGRTLCHIVNAGKGEYYVFYPDATGDSFYHLLKTAGETEIVPGTASEYYVLE